MLNVQNKKLLLKLVAIVFIMVALAFASIPLYSMFCKVTGYGGTIQRDINFSNKKGTRKIKILFDSNVDKDLSWHFTPKQREVTLVPGENVLVFYESENLTDQSVKGMAVYNVSPFKVGKYFKKIEGGYLATEKDKKGRHITKKYS